MVHIGESSDDRQERDSDCVSPVRWFVLGGRVGTYVVVVLSSGYGMEKRKISPRLIFCASFLFSDVGVRFEPSSNVWVVVVEKWSTVLKQWLVVFEKLVCGEQLFGDE